MPLDSKRATRLRTRLVDLVNVQKTEGDRRANHAELTAAEEDKIASSQMTIEKNLIRQGDLAVRVEGMKGDLPETRRSLAADRVLPAKLAESDASGLGATQEEHRRGTVWPSTKRSSPGMITMCWSFQDNSPEPTSTQRSRPVHKESLSGWWTGGARRMITNECWHGSSSEDKRTARGLEHRDGCRKVPHVGRARLVESQGFLDESPSSNLGRESQGEATPVDRGAGDASSSDVGGQRRQTLRRGLTTRSQVKVSVISKTDSLRTTFEHFARSV